MVRLAALGAATAAAAFAFGAADASPARARPDASPARTRPDASPRARPGVPLPPATMHAPMREGPPLAHTGGFGEPTCIACHFDGALNEPSGSLTIDGVPTRYAPRARYRLTITVRHPELQLAGFELSARFETGADSGKQAGTLTVDDDRAAISTDSATSVQYAHHLRSGTTPLSPGLGRWTVTWVAPSAGSAPVVIHVAANAGNDNDSPLGDYIFARSVSIPMGEK